MKKIVILATLIALITLLIAFYWFATRRDYEPAPFWQTSDESNSATINHNDWQDILDEYLIKDDASGVNLIDYDSLKEEAWQDLNRYISYLTDLDPRQLRRAEQFAYWVNLYNALTISVILDNYPVDSITQISKKTLAFGPWDDVLTIIAGTEVTLNDIEHRILRANWHDYRIHFAVNCASIGCPNIQDKAFSADNTEMLLNQAAYEFISHARGVAVGEHGLVLSSIFDWYQADFGSNEEQMLDTISRYVAEQELEKFKAQKRAVSYQYDWSLNDAK